MSRHTLVQQALQEAWHVEAAETSLQRWQDLARQEGWSLSAEAFAMLTRVFGASWYFTRFIFFRGMDVLHLFDPENQSVEKVTEGIATLTDLPLHEDVQQMIELLRIQKNELMLSVLILQLAGSIGQEQAEHLLTALAESVLFVMYRLYELDALQGRESIIIAMGRFAGEEMNYGSDLDLVFIEKLEADSEAEPSFPRIRKMLRHIAQMDPSGALYEIDMRLRPHGSSGTLVTPVESFIQFHREEREIWERQMMTRSRVVCGSDALARDVQQHIEKSVYQEYDRAYLANEIMKVRLLVEQELAGGKDRIELKRGRGGIMDIDFMTHYFQLGHGHEDTAFRQTGTRRIIELAQQKELLGKKTASTLLEAYGFYKTSEMALRIFDMKSTSKVAKTVPALLPLARAHGFLKDDADTAVMEYLETLTGYRENVRRIFEEILDISA